MIEIRNWWLRTAVFLTAAALGYGAVAVLRYRAGTRDWSGDRNFDGGRIEQFFAGFGSKFPPPLAVESRVVSRRGMVTEVGKFTVAAAPFADFLEETARRFESSDLSAPSEASRTFRRMAELCHDADIEFPSPAEAGGFSLRRIQMYDCPVYLAFRREDERVTGYLLILYDHFL